MKEEYINLTLENIDTEHICCAISDKKHQNGVVTKKEWLKKQIKNGHVFRKLNQNGKIFIEYGNLEDEFVPVVGKNYIYIYCLWVSGSFKGKGHGENLIKYAIEDAKKKNKSGICVVVGNKKMPFLSDKKFLEKYGFKVVDTTDFGVELIAISFDDKETPKFTDAVKKNKIDEKCLVIYYNDECPYISNCLLEIVEVCKEKKIDLKLHYIDTVDKAKKVPCFMNNFCVFYNGKFITHELLNKGRLIKFLCL